MEIFGAFDFKQRCIECSVYDIKVPREYIRTHGIHLLSLSLSRYIDVTEHSIQNESGRRSEFFRDVVSLVCVQMSNEALLHSQQLQEDFFQLSSPSHIILARDQLRYEIC